MKKVFYIFLFIASAAFISSCSKEGPTGPQGVQGPQGPAGDQGIQGIQGLDGNANVHSYTYNVFTSDWILNAPNYGVDLSVPEITQSILDDGAVLVYMSNGSGGWMPLPYTSWYSSYARLIKANILYEDVTIWVLDSDLTQTPNPGDRTFKIVVIGGSVASKMPSNIDLNNYMQVAKYLKLK
jgi:hypothetical protein